MKSFSIPKLSEFLELIRYSMTSILVYIYIFAAIYILVDIFLINKVVAYVMVYITSYVMEYTVTLYFVFHKQHGWGKTVKYFAYIAAFLPLSTLVYKFLLFAGFYYLLATLLTAIILMPVRFLTNKYWVYR